MYRSAVKSRILRQMTFVQNGIDEFRRTAHMTVDTVNNGGSYVEVSNEDKNNSRFIFIIHRTR